MFWDLFGFFLYLGHPQLSQSFINQLTNLVSSLRLHHTVFFISWFFWNSCFIAILSFDSRVFILIYLKFAEFYLNLQHFFRSPNVQMLCSGRFFSACTWVDLVFTFLHINCIFFFVWWSHLVFHLPAYSFFVCGNTTHFSRFLSLHAAVVCSQSFFCMFVCLFLAYADFIASFIQSIIPIVYFSK